ncbi:hypothetical protein LINPERHAP1_LOCUS40744, partial [Linum perenne]
MLEGRSKVMTWPSNSSPKVVLMESKQPTAKSSLLMLLPSMASSSSSSVGLLDSASSLHKP